MGKRNQKLLFHLLMICFFDMLAYAMLSPIITLIFLEGPYSIFPPQTPSRHFLFGLFLSLFSFVQIFSVPIWGKLSLSLGKAKVLKISFLGGLIAYLICAFSLHINQGAYLFLGVFIAGLTGTTIPTINALIAEASKQKHWIKSFSLLGAVIGLAFILGPQITALIMDSISKETLCFTIYSLCALISAFNLIYVAIFIKDSKKSTLTERTNQEKIFSLSTFRREFLKLEKELKCILIFQFFVSLAWYFFIKFFQLFLIESMLFNEKESCYGISFLGLCCALWQGLRALRDIPIYKKKHSLTVIILIMACSILSFFLIKNEFSVLISLLFLSFTYSMILPTSMTLLLSKGKSEKEIKTSVFQSILSVAKVIAPLLSGICLTFTHWASAILSSTAIICAGFIVLFYPTFFKWENK